MQLADLGGLRCVNAMNADCLGANLEGIAVDDTGRAGHLHAPAIDRRGRLS